MSDSWLWLVLSHSVAIAAALWLQRRVCRAAVMRANADVGDVRDAAREPILHVLAHGEIRTAAQPIIDLATGAVVGAEMLSRFAGGASPDQWFAAAAAADLLLDLELAALDRSLAAARDIPGDVYLSLNASPATLMSPRLHAALLESGVPPQRIVLEVTEHMAIDDYASLRRALDELRLLGIRTAVDDAGAGYASFRHVLKLEPDYIKLDREIVCDIDRDAGRRALAAAIVMFSLEVNAAVVAEGVETRAELELIATLGIEAVQGYLVQCPTEDRNVWRSWASARFPVIDAVT